MIIQNHNCFREVQARFVIWKQTGFRRRKSDLFTVDQSTVIIELGIESGPIRGKPRVDRFQHARGDEREEPDCHGEYAFGTCSPAKRKKERGGNKLESPSNPFAYTISREKENGNERERERGEGGRERKRRIGLVKRFQACRYSGRFSSTLMKPITLRFAKGSPLISAPNISRALLKPRSVPRHVLVTLDTDVKAIHLVCYSIRDSHVRTSIILQFVI